MLFMRKETLDYIMMNDSPINIEKLKFKIQGLFFYLLF